MKRIKRILALVIAMAMVLGMTSMAAFAADPDFKITVTNSNESVSIDGQTFTAYKLFENTYAGMSDDPYTGNNTVYGLDSDPHAYYIKKGSPFFDAASVTTETVNGVTTYKLANGLTDAQKKASPLAQILEYFVLTEMPSEANKAEEQQLVLVQPKTQKVGDKDVSTFTAEKAYELAQKMAPIIESLGTALDSWKVSGTASGESVEINANALGAGYYLVTGGGKAYKEGDTTGRATGDVVTAAVALTTTDPAAQIIAKLDAPKVVKTINEATQPKYNNKGVGDTVSYKVTTDVPNMTGYEKYFFIMNDTLSKGLTLNDTNPVNNTHTYIDDNGTADNTADDFTAVDNGFEVVISKKNGTSETLTRVADHAAAVAQDATNKKTYYVEKDADNNSFEVVFHDFIQYKGNLIVDDTATDPTKTAPFSTYDYRTLNVDKSKVGTYYSEYDGATITVKYSATVNEDAVLGATGNVNTAKLEFSNKPDKTNNGEPGNEDKPGYGEGFDNVTEISPESKTITYVTGLKTLKFAKDGENKNPLKGAKFSLVGEDLRNLVKQTSVIYRAPKTGETADVYELTGNRFTKTAPTADKIVNKNGAVVSGTTVPDYGKIVYGTLREYEGFASASATATEVTLPDGSKESIYMTVPAGINPTLVEDEVESYEYQRFVEDPSGTYYRLKDGTFTNNASLPDSSYDNKTKKYTAQTEPWAEMTVEEKEAATVTQIVETDENGVLLFRGLQAGEYTLTEIEAPEGYNLLSQPINIKVEWAATKAQDNANVADADTCTWTISYKLAGDSDWTTITATDDTTITDLFQLDVENKAGTELPSTGGIGTTIFYIVGAILVIGAGVILVTKRRMDA